MINALKYILFSFIIVFVFLAPYNALGMQHEYCWQGIILKYSYGAEFIQKNNSIDIYYNPKKIFGKMTIDKHSLPRINELQKKAKDDNDFIHIEDTTTTIDKYEAFYVKDKSRKNGLIVIMFFIPQKDTTILYSGPEENYKFFRPMIDSIRFTDGE